MEGINKVKINLIDVTLAGCHSMADAAARCGTNQEKHRSPKKVEYVRDQSAWDGITIFTDKTLSMVDQVDSKLKVGVILEGWVLDLEAYKTAYALKDKFDYIFTYNPELLKLDPDKFKFNAADTICIDTNSMVIGDKSKLLSMTYSTKQHLPGHKLRHMIAKDVLPKTNKNIDLFGTGTGKKLEMKSEALNDYRFSIEVENSFLPNYFTEKLLDCFATGTIPIYWGCPNVNDYFNTDGIIQFENVEDLANILSSLDEEAYNSKKKAIEENYHTAMDKYLEPDDNIYEKVVAYERQRNN
jgi:hypothetical protein